MENKIKEITNDIRLAIFGMYPKQSILICEPNIEPVSHYLEGIDYSLEEVIAERVNWNPEWIKMHLNPLSSITEHDVMEVAKIQHGTLETWKMVKIDLNTPENLLPMCWGAYQYLQSKGYALPYLNYSVEDLVEAGIYELIKQNG